MTTIVKATSKGQITLPASSRKKFTTDRFLVKQLTEKLEVTPLDVDRLESQSEYTVFDAIRDNQGKGIKARDLVRFLKKTLK
jgi:bifunctional DNA-binding transcriptional regulator/antitoxin component of YhaV-PrlF toxin-antitoxin module